MRENVVNVQTKYSYSYARVIQNKTRQESITDIQKKVHAMSHHKVIIIGAGASGLAAAVRLASLNIEDVIILEASEARVGGRVWSERLREDGPRVEMGAQWIHGEEGNVAQSLASDLGFLENTEDSREGHCEHEALSILNGHPVPQETIRRLTMARRR